MTDFSNPAHLPLYVPSTTLPSIRCRAPGEVDQGYRMLREFYSKYKRLVLPEEQERSGIMLHTLTNEESVHVLDLLRLEAQREVNAGRTADPLTLSAMNKIRKEVDEHQREFQRLMSVL